MELEAVKQIFLGALGIFLASYLMARFTISRCVEWAENSITTSVGILYGSWMVAGALGWHFVVWGMKKPSLVLATCAMISLTIALDNLLGIRFFQKSSPAHIVFVVFPTMIIGVLAFYALNLLF